MRTLRFFRYGAWATVVIAGLSLAAFALLAPQRQSQTPQGFPEIGGHFRLTAHTGAEVDSEKLKGKPFAVFFGFTRCPDVCPTTLFELSEYLKELGPDADRLHVLFITVDAERDTRAALAEYMQSFDSRILALTGEPSEIEAVVKAFKVFAAKRPMESGDYTMDHTASVFLMDRTGQFRSTIARGESRKVALQKLRLILER